MASRPRPTSSLPKPPAHLDPTCVISDAAVLVGIHPITIGPNAILHPRSRINSTYGPVTIGSGCIICERGSVGLLQEADAGAPAAVELEANVTIEPAATVEALRVGTSCVLEAGSRVGAGAVLGKAGNLVGAEAWRQYSCRLTGSQNCRITPLCTVDRLQELDAYTVVYGDNLTRREKPGLEVYRLAAHEKQLGVLRRLIPSNLAKWQTGE